MKNSKKITSILIVSSMVITMLVGCGSKSTNTSDQTTNNAQATQTGNKRFDPTAMKTLYSSALKSLVTAKTITQSQSDKVLALETKNVQRGAGKGRPSRSNKQSGTNNKNVANRGKGTNNMGNKLSTLVSSKVITLAQSNTINQKIQDAMQNQNSKSTQN